MAYTVRRIDYCHLTIQDSPGAAHEVLSQLADLSVNLVAVTAIPFWPARTQLTVFPEDTAKLQRAAKRSNISLDGPHPALLVQGDDEIGALARIHEKLFTANVHVVASTGVADGKGSYGYIIYIRADEYELAAEALGV